MSGFGAAAILGPILGGGESGEVPFFISSNHVKRHIAPKEEV